MANDPGPVVPAGPTSAQAEPSIRIVAGHPTDEEVAAVTVAVAVAAKLAATAGSAPPRRRPANWADRSRLLRLPVRAGPDAWRRSGLPR